MKVFIQNNPLYHPCVKYTLGIFAANKKIKIEFVSDLAYADLRIDETPQSDFPIALNFYSGLKENKFQHENYFPKNCLVTSVDGKEDLLATCFYMINSLQEYNAEAKNELISFVPATPPLHTNPPSINLYHILFPL